MAVRAQEEELGVVHAGDEDAAVAGSGRVVLDVPFPLASAGARVA